MIRILSSKINYFFHKPLYDEFFNKFNVTFDSFPFEKLIILWLQTLQYLLK